MGELILAAAPLGNVGDASTRLREEIERSEFVAAEGAMANDILEQRLSRTDITRAAATIAHRISTHLNRAFRRS